MINPFLVRRLTDETDQALAAQAVQGSRKSLEELVLRHRA